MQPAVDFTLYLITDRHNCGGRDLSTVVGEALEGGVKGVQLREKDLNSRALYDIALELRTLTDRFGARLLINDRVDIALAVGADGVHLGSAGIPVRRARQLLGENRLIGVSCHDRASATNAEEDGADFITFGPVFYTPSKAAYGEPVGVERLAEVVGLLRIPVFALGGVSGENLPQVIETGCHGIALISAVMAAPDSCGAAKSLCAALQARE